MAVEKICTVDDRIFNDPAQISAEQGAPYILQESEVLVNGWMKLFIGDTNYKRCKRLHEILAVAFEVLHFEKFLSVLDSKDEIMTLLSR